MVVYRDDSSYHDLRLLVTRDKMESMASIVTIYGTGEGQTAKVADRIADELGIRGHETMTVNVKEAGSVELADFEAVLLGASIHMGRHQKAVRKFATANRDVLMTKPTGFFQVSGASGEGTDAGDTEAIGYLDEFIAATNWRPDRIGFFGGAFRFSEYGFLMRAVMKRIVKKKNPELDPPLDIEFTDWEEVAAFADEFGTFVEERLAEAIE